MRRTALLLVLLPLGCAEGGDHPRPDALADPSNADSAGDPGPEKPVETMLDAPGDEATDLTADQAVELPADPGLPEVVFLVGVTESIAGETSHAFGHVENPPYRFEIPAVEVARAGDCALVDAYFDAFCEPPCPYPQYCDAGNVCREHPPRLSAGTITVKGLKSALTLVPEGQYHYYQGDFVPAPEDGDVFDAGDVLTAVAEGADLPAFSLTTHGVAAVDASLPCDTPAAGKHVTVTWTPGGLGDRMWFSIRSPNHGTQFSRIECETEDDGELVVDASLVDGYLAGFHPAGTIAVLERMSRAVGVTSGGAVAFEVSSRVSCSGFF